MQVSLQTPQAMGQTSAPMFGAGAEKNTLNNLIETHGEHADVSGAPANATFSNRPIMTTAVMKGGTDALIGKPFENNAGETVYLKGFQDTEKPAAVGGTSGGVNKNEGISFDSDVKIIEKPKPFTPEIQEEPSTSAVSTSSNPMEDILKFLVSLLASLFGGLANGSGTDNNDNTQAQSDPNNMP